MEILSNIDFNNLVQYCIFPNSFIRNGKLPSQQKVLFEIFCSYDHLDKEGNRKGWCDPALDTVAEQLGLSKRATQIHLKRLVEAGMVTVVYRNTEVVKGDPRSSIYILNILPGLSENDRRRIAAARTIEIKHLISGLSTIKVQTATGMQYTTKEEFDLELLITGNRASTTVEGECADAEEVISKEEENTVTDGELFGKRDSASSGKFKDDKSTEFDGDPEVEISFGPNRHAEVRNSRTGVNSTDSVERIRCGNYRGITGRDLANYFKSLYEDCYPGEEFKVDRIKDTGIMQAQLKSTPVDILVPKIEFFVKNYHKLFSSADYPRPRIFHLSITWIINKLDTAVRMNDQATMKTEPTKRSTKEIII